MPPGSPIGTRLSVTGSERHIEENSGIMTAPLEVTDLRKQFAIGRPAIDGVSFAVPAGEIVVLLGPSGCGKSTLLALAAGLDEIAGQAELVAQGPEQGHVGIGVNADRPAISEEIDHGFLM